MGDPRRSIGLTTACRVGTVRLGVFFSHFTITEGAPGAPAQSRTPLAITTNSAKHHNDSIAFCFYMHWLRMRVNKHSLLRQR